MKILIKVKPETRSQAATDNELYDVLVKQAEAAYQTETDDSCAYFRETVEDSPFISLIDGAKNPDDIIAEAENWNERIAECFNTALQAIMPKEDTESILQQWLNTAQVKFDDLERTAMSLNNKIHRYAERTLFINDDMTTRLEDSELQDIKANPQNYAIIEVTPD